MSLPTILGFFRSVSGIVLTNALFSAFVIVYRNRDEEVGVRASVADVVALVLIVAADAAGHEAVVVALVLVVAADAAEHEAVDERELDLRGM